MDVPSTALRFWARLVDGVMVGVFLVPAFGLSAFSLFSGPIWISWPFVAYLLLVPVLYEALSVWIFGTTFGKWLFFLRVVPAHDSSAELKASQIFNRALAGQFSFFFAYAPQSLLLFRYDRTHLVDWLGGTRVVTTRLREKKIRIHWLFGAFLFLLFFFSGMEAASLFVGGLSLSTQGIYFSP